MTVTMHGPKVGHESRRAASAPARWSSPTSGSSRSRPSTGCVTPAILDAVPRRSPRSRTSTRPARCSSSAARAGLTGAPRLAAEAAFRADAGYVAVAVPDSTLRRLRAAAAGGGQAAAAPRTADDLDRARSSRSPSSPRRPARSRSGPGSAAATGRRRSCGALLAELDRPAVVDADALHDLEPFERPAPTVLTPHAGELARLLGVESDWVDAHRLEAVRRAVESFRCVVPAQGRGHARRRAGRGRARRRRSATPALATAGTRRRADRDRRRVPRQGRRRAHGRGRGGGGAAARVAGDPAVGRGRERRGRPRCRWCSDAPL